METEMSVGNPLSSKDALLAVIIATKNRSDAIERYALPSLERSAFRDFVCVIWDASIDEKTRDIVNGRAWNFTADYNKAPRAGLTSQRNDAVRYTLNNYSDVRYILFIDDDSELFNDTLLGLIESFQKENISIVNLVSSSPNELNIKTKSNNLLRFRHHGATDFLYNYGAFNEENGIPVDWASGAGMAFKADIFRSEKYFFPESFQRFGGYALGEDFALTYFLCKKKHAVIINSVKGSFIHWVVPGGRPDIRGITASKWYNFHLLFDSIYDDVHGLRKFWLTVKFKMFMCASAVQALRRSRSFDVISAVRGINDARIALKEYYKTHNLDDLFKC